MNLDQIIRFFEDNQNIENKKGKASFGINTDRSYGLSNPQVHELVKMIRKSVKIKSERNELAIKLWDSGIHEARMASPLFADPLTFGEDDLNKWVNDINSWDICDNLCMKFICKRNDAYQKAIEYSNSGEEFIRRAGIVTIASLAVHDKTASDDMLEQFYPLLNELSTDPRNFVKKAVNWAIRQIGKRNKSLNQSAIGLCLKIEKLDDRTAKWIAKDALRELRSEKVQTKLNR